VEASIAKACTSNARITRKKSTRRVAGAVTPGLRIETWGHSFIGKPSVPGKAFVVNREMLWGQHLV